MNIPSSISNSASSADFDTDSKDVAAEEYSERPWIDLQTSHDIEAWIDQYNRELQASIRNPHAVGCGVCFTLREGGEIFLHTTQDAVLLDVTPEAEWVAPVICAATGLPASRSRIWVMPEDRLTQLVLGLSSLIESTRIVASHDYKAKK